MERLVTVKDMANRYGCSLPTARKYIREMYHMENPLTAPEWALREWEQSRERMPRDPNRREQVQKIKTKGRVIVPRKRGQQ